MFAGEEGASCCVDWCWFPFHYFRMCTTCYREANYQRLFKRHISEYWDSSLIQGVMLLLFLSSLFHPQQNRLFYIYFQVSTSEYCGQLPVELGSVLCEELHYVWESCVPCNFIGPRIPDLVKEVAAKRQLTPLVYTVGDAPGKKYREYKYLVQFKRG